jgi:hypothetical protein
MRKNAYFIMVSGDCPSCHQRQSTMLSSARSAHSPRDKGSGMDRETLASAAGNSPRPGGRPAAIMTSETSCCQSMRPRYPETWNLQPSDLSARGFLVCRVGVLRQQARGEPCKPEVLARAFIPTKVKMMNFVANFVAIPRFSMREFDGRLRRSLRQSLKKSFGTSSIET